MQPTLKLLPKDVIVIAQPEAAQLAKELGYKNVIHLDHFDEVLPDQLHLMHFVLNGSHHVDLLT